MKPGFIDNCEQERLHLSGAIQAYGSLLVASSERICTHVSENIEQFINLPVAGWLDRPLPQIFADWCDEYDRQERKRLQISAVSDFSAIFDLVITRNDGGHYVFELLPHIDMSSRPKPLTGFATPNDPRQLQELQQILLEMIAQATGFQRVMLYLFNDQGDGEVVAEVVDVQSGYGEYLGLLFPASDVPQIARNLYMKNPWRLIADASAEPCPLISRSEMPPDLSYADLRSVSPVHLLYLANMGVRTSLSFPLFFASSLFGLVACHHQQTVSLPQSTLNYLSDCIRAFCVAYTSYHAQQRVQFVDGLNHRFTDFSRLIEKNGGLEEGWLVIAPWLLREFATDGATLCIDDQAFNFGNSFETSALLVFDRWFCGQRDEMIWIGDNLANQIPLFPFSRVAGVLALKIQTQKRKLRVYLCRQEHIYEVAWGGNPTKPVEYHDGKVGIAPRRSFEKWVEKRLGYSRPWDNNSRLLVMKLRNVLRELCV